MNKLLRKIKSSFILSVMLFPMILSCDSAEDETSAMDDENGDNEEVLSYQFVIGDTEYEVVALNLSWDEAAEYAVNKGGELADINSMEEQEAIFSELVENSNFNFEKSIAFESNSAKVWIGGSDAVEEGKWIWDGNNSGSGIHFFQGDFFTGSAVDDQYTNWGSGREPDNFGATGQNALAIGMTNWIFGSAGEWNDLKDTNRLYFIIEYE